jgi:putative tricarboxylic transport membrane protein
MLVLGIPPNAVMAIMIGAMILHGIAPGPRIMESQPQLFWGMVASMWVGNLMLLIINLPLIGLWVRLLKVPYRLLFPAVVLFCCIGIYSINNQPFDVLLTGVIGLSGYLLLKHGFEPAPLLIAFVLGKLIEENLRQAMITSRGTVNVFFERPLSLTFLCIAAVLLILSLLPAIRRKREEVFTE